MHLQQIELQNFKTIKDFKADFSGDVYLVTGENGMGKSTLIQAIGILLTGNRSDNLLTKGEEKGFAKMTVGTGDDAYEVELRFSEKNPRGTLVIGKKDSGLKSDRKSALESIFKYQDFDANEFLKWSETAEGRRKQAELVKGLLPKEIQEQINSLDIEAAEAREKRTEIGRDLKMFEAQIKGFDLQPIDFETYKTEVDVSELTSKYQEAVIANSKREAVVERLNARERELNEIPEKIQAKQVETYQKVNRLKEQILALEAEINEAEESFKNEKVELTKKEKELKKINSEAEAWLKENPAVEVEEIQQKINSSKEHNQKATKVAQCSEAKKKHEQALENYSKQSEKITKAEETKKALIEKADLPVKGLDFSEDGIFLNGIPFREGEVATSEAMEVAVSLIIAKNPTTKIFRITQGESLGSDRLKAIIDFAKKRGYQGFIEEMKRGQNELIVYQYSEK